MSKALGYEELLAVPPELKARECSLPDGRKYTLYDLPASVVDRVYRMSKDGNMPIHSAAEIAAQALLGRFPGEEETQRLLDSMGANIILGIFSNALNASTLTEENVTEAKKP